MKQFNLKEYLANPNRKLVTRDGREVRIICTDKKNDCPIVALVKSPDGKEITFSYTKEGEYFPGASDNKDLFFTNKKHEGWGIIYKSSLFSSIFSSKEEAKEFVERTGTKNTAAIAKIEWEE